MKLNFKNNMIKFLFFINYLYMEKSEEMKG